MGRSIARHSKSLKNFHISWMEEMGADPDSDQHEREWNDFKRSVKRDLLKISDTFDTPYDETWPEDDEVQLLMENGHAKIVLSEYMGLACVGIVPQPNRDHDVWGNLVAERSNNLAVRYCTDTLGPRLKKCLDEKFTLYKGGTYASNGTQVFYRT